MLDVGYSGGATLHIQQHSSRVLHAGLQPPVQNVSSTDYTHVRSKPTVLPGRLANLLKDSYI